MRIYDKSIELVASVSRLSRRVQHHDGDLARQMRRAVVSVPLASVIYLLEIFVGILQAYIFTLLSALFIGQGVEMGHHGHSDEHAHKEHAH